MNNKKPYKLFVDGRWRLECVGCGEIVERSQVVASPRCFKCKVKQAKEYAQRKRDEKR